VGELARQHGLHSNGMNSASGLLPPEEVSAPKMAERPNWVEPIGSTVTRILEFS